MQSKEQKSKRTEVAEKRDLTADEDDIHGWKRMSGLE
jgi:hypothetical protein